MFLQPQFEELVAFAGSEALMPELLKAKAAWFAMTGEVYADDPLFEMRMAGFLEFYVFDRKLEDQGVTPAELFWRNGKFQNPADAPIFEGFLHTWHALFEVRKLSSDTFRLRDLFTDKDADVFERRQLVGISKGDIIEARLLPMEDKLVLSKAFFFHPAVVRKAILAEIKRRRKSVAAFDTQQFLHALSRMQLKYERYRNIDPLQIYDFSRV